MEKLQNETSRVKHVRRGNSSPQNGQGHGEWIAAHLAEMKCPDSQVRRRSKDVQHVKLQSVVDVKSLFDHLTFLSSPSSVEDKRCGFDLEVAKQCVCEDSRQHSLGFPQTRIWLMLTKDCVTAADMLRPCLKQGEYEFAPWTKDAPTCGRRKRPTET